MHSRLIGLEPATVKMRGRVSGRGINQTPSINKANFYYFYLEFAYIGC